MWLKSGSPTRTCVATATPLSTRPVHRCAPVTSTMAGNVVVVMISVSSEFAFEGIDRRSRQKSSVVAKKHRQAEQREELLRVEERGPRRDAVAVEVEDNDRPRCVAAVLGE